MPSLSRLTEHLLHTLLDRFERPNRQRVARLRLNDKEHADYFSQKDVAARQRVNAELKRLAGQGFIKLHWRKYEENNWLEAMDLAPEHAPALYALLSRAPQADRAAALCQLLAAQAPHVEWHAAFLRWAVQQVDTHRSPAPLDLDNPQFNADLLSALAAIPNLQSPVLERTFSTRLFGDSKRFESLRRSVLTVLRRFNAQATTFIDDDDSVLRAHFLERAPEYVPLAGPLVLRVNQAEVNLSAFTPSVALSAAMLRQAEVMSCGAMSVITVENATSFSELAAVRPTSALLVYIAGFASPTVVSLLQAFRVAAPAIQFWHWGDMDVGGLRILAHLRRHLETVRALAMDSRTFERHRIHAQPLTQRERASLLSLRILELLADCGSLIDSLLAAGRKLEQEAVSPQFVIGLLD